MSVSKRTFNNVRNQRDAAVRTMGKMGVEIALLEDELKRERAMSMNLADQKDEVGDLYVEKCAECDDLREKLLSAEQTEKRLDKSASDAWEVVAQLRHKCHRLESQQAEVFAEREAIELLQRERDEAQAVSADWRKACRAVQAQLDSIRLERDVALGNLKAVESNYEGLLGDRQNVAKERDEARKELSALHEAVRRLLDSINTFDGWLAGHVGCTAPLDFVRGIFERRVKLAASGLWNEVPF